MVIQYIQKTVLFLLTATLCAACVREDLNECAVPLTFTFHYIYNIENEDLFIKEIDNVTLFIYDTQGKLIRQEIIERKDMIDENKYQLTLAKGEYKIVSYGNSKVSYNYISPQYYHEAINSVHRDVNKQVAPTIEPLFYGAIDKLTITDTHKSEQKIFFHKYSNMVRVILRSTNPAQSLSTMECKISAINGDYKFDNTIYGNDRVHYIPKSGNQTYEFNLLRLWQGDDSMLSVVEQTTGLLKKWYEGSLTALLLKKPGTDLDLEDTFEVILTLNTNDNTVKITVNDWEVIDHNSGL